MTYNNFIVWNKLMKVQNINTNLPNPSHENQKSPKNIRCVIEFKTDIEYPVHLFTMVN